MDYTGRMEISDEQLVGRFLHKRALYGSGILKNDERIVVIGNPSDNGVVNADLIRVFNAQ